MGVVHAPDVGQVNGGLIQVVARKECVYLDVAGKKINPYIAASEEAGGKDAVRVVIGSLTPPIAGIIVDGSTCCTVRKVQRQRADTRHKAPVGTRGGNGKGMEATGSGKCENALRICIRKQQDVVAGKRLQLVLRCACCN